MLEICLLSIDLRVCRSHNVNVGVVQWLSQAYSRVVSNFLGAGTCLPACAVQNADNSGRQCIVTTGTLLVPCAGHSER